MQKTQKKQNRLTPQIQTNKQRWHARESLIGNKRWKRKTQTPKRKKDPNPKANFKPKKRVSRKRAGRKGPKKP
jgi:hypothetical protein